MSYRYTTGSVRRGDIYFEDDREGDPTYIDFGQDSITLRPSGSQILYAQSDAVGIGTTTPSHKLTIAGNVSASAFYGDGSNLTGISGGGGSDTITNMTHHRYNDGSGTGLEYIPWAGTSEQPSPSWITQGVAAYAGKLKKVLVRSSKNNPTMGSTTVGIHINVDGNTVINQTPEETQTVNMTSANTTYTFNFSNSNHFGPGDIIGVSIDPTNAHGNVNVTCVWEYQST